MKMRDTKNNKNRVRKVCKKYFLGVMIAAMLLQTGCQKTSKTEIVITTGLTGKDLFKIDGEVCKLSDARILLWNVQKQYEKVFGENYWEQSFGETGTLEDYVKEQAVLQLSQMKSMYLLAEKSKISISQEEQSKLTQAAREYCAAFSDEAKQTYGIEEKRIKHLMEEYVLSKKVYNQIIGEVNTEISDDEARIIIVQHVFLKTDSSDNEDSSSKDTESRNAQNEKAYTIWERANAGENFESLMVEFSDDNPTSLTIGRGEMSSSYEEAAFNLRNNEISQITETLEGLYIIKCLSNYEQTDTQENKTKLYEKRCSQLFNKTYDAFMKKQSLEFNDKAWDKITIEAVDDFPELNIWEVVDRYLGES